MINGFSILPQEIRYNKVVSATAKIVWAEIYCYNYCKIYNIRNKTLADDLSLSVTQISRLITQLKNNNLVISFELNHERRLMVVDPRHQEEKKERVKRVISPGLESFYKIIDSMKQTKTAK